jgi:rhodanese-related sulfurtransferase
MDAQPQSLRFGLASSRTAHIRKVSAMTKTITIEEFAPLSRQGGFDLIDVRTPAEFFEVHAVGALLTPLDTLNPQTVMAARGARAAEPLYVICRSGSRSLQACQIFERAGFPNVVSVEGGTIAWQKSGLPVNRGIRRMISLERQNRIASGLLVLLGTLLGIISPWFFLLAIGVGIDMTSTGLFKAGLIRQMLTRAPWNKDLAAMEASCCSGSNSCGI